MARPSLTRPVCYGARLNPMKLRKMEDRHKEIEAQIERVEAEIAADELELGNFRSVEETVKLNNILTERRANHEILLAEWEQVAELIEGNR